MTTRILVTRPPGAASKLVGTDLEVVLPAGCVKRKLLGGSVVAELTELQLSATARAHPYLAFEADQDLVPLAPMPGLGVRVGPDRAEQLSFDLACDETGEPIDGAIVFAQQLGLTSQGSGLKGRATVSTFEPVVHVVVSPACNYWSKVLPAQPASSTTKVRLKRLVPRGSAAWERELVGVGADNSARGEGVKVGVVDSGIAEHQDLQVQGGWCALDERAEAFLEDESGHGTHCAGIIAGKGLEGGVAGIAPHAELYSLRVHPGGKLSDLLAALQWAINNQLDVLNLSLGIAQPSLALSWKVQEAAAAGITLVAAAATDAEQVSSPAGLDGVIGVSAIGQLRELPEDTAHVLRVSELCNRETGLFVPNFAAQGGGLNLVAPGVAVISSVPGGYAAWDGTSAACAFVAGLVCVALSAYPELRTKDALQPARVRELLESSALDLTLPAELQGTGLAHAGALLAEAEHRRATAQVTERSDADRAQRLTELVNRLGAQRGSIRELLDSLSP
ncbi:MAG TPA: S8 family serine peptidase [Polyangiaceae bacterium]|nr:S8 family serine peptidase [Polyangiaceae bacterium]